MYTATIAIDNVLAEQTVSLQSEMNVRELIESVFVQLQSAQNRDPFRFGIDYFGYDYYGGVTSYLGYGIASINQYVSNTADYWDLFINGLPSPVGMDSYLVQPNDKIELKWTAVAEAPGSAGARMQQISVQRATGT